MSTDLTNKPSIIERCILKTYPEWDKDRHYWSAGDVIEFTQNSIVICTRSLGFRRSEFIVVKGFNKGSVIEIAIGNTPYIAKQNYSAKDMITLASKYCLLKPKLLYTRGDILLDEHLRLLVITEIIETGRGYYAFVLNDPEQCTYNYNHTSIYLHNIYRDYLNEKG